MDYEEPDALQIRVAVEVFGWKETDKRFPDHDPNWIGYEAPWYETPDGEIQHYTHIPDYPRKIQDAWLVVEKLREMGAWINVSIGTHKINWECRGIINEGKDSEVRFIEHADTAPLAICLAALKAVALP